MSVDQSNKIDGLGKEKNGLGLYLMIADHLDWNDEYEHLLLLQEKINTYIEYITTEQYLSVYPDGNFDKYFIEIHSKYEITDKCKEFLDMISKQLDQYNIYITTIIAGSKNREVET